MEVMMDSWGELEGKGNGANILRTNPIMICGLSRPDPMETISYGVIIYNTMLLSIR